MYNKPRKNRNKYIQKQICLSQELIQKILMLIIWDMLLIIILEVIYALNLFI